MILNRGGASLRKTLSNLDLSEAEEVLKFRDCAFETYFTNRKYLNMVEKKFGIDARKNIEEMIKIKLKRRILGN